MQFPTTILLAFGLASTTLAADHALVTSFSDDLCHTDGSPFEVEGSQSYRCMPVTNKRSIKVGDKRGCTITAWSGSDCHGDSWKIPDGDLDCHSILHAAVEIKC